MMSSHAISARTGSEGWTRLKKIMPDEDQEGEDERRYRAPALEKGLDILELLAIAERPLNISTIVQRLGRSTGELFRMIQVLEHRGFVAQDSEGFSITTRLFEMGLARPPIRNLVEIAMPVMRQFSARVGQSCHLALPSRSNIVVVARMEAREQIGFSVRVGYRQPLHLTTSGATLYAFQPAEIRAQWEELFDPAPGEAALAAFRAQCDAIRAQGYARIASGFIEGITDISAPVLRGDFAAAALSVPFVKSISEQMPVDEVTDHVRAATEDIARKLLHNDGRV